MKLELDPIERKHPLAECETCPLFKRPFVPSYIPTHPVAAVVSRSPAYMEARVGEPFSGKSGEVLNFLLKEQGVNRKDVLLTNTVLCSPSEGEVPREAIKACAPRLHKELSGIDLVMAAGREAVNVIIGGGTIDRHRGYRISQEQYGRIVVATNNPALVLRDDSTFPNLRKDFKRAFNPIPEPALPKVEVIEDVEEAKEFLRAERDNSGLVACDTETRGGLTHKARIVCLQIARAGDRAIVLGERGGIWKDRAFVEDHLRPFIESSDHAFIWHNGKFDVKILRYGYGIEARIDEDTLLMSYALDERSGQSEKQFGGLHKLEYLLAEELGWPDYEPESVKEFKKDGIVRNYDDLHEYAGRDAAGSFQLYDAFSERLVDEGVERPYRHLLLEGAEACSRIEVNGFRFDPDKALDLMEFEVNPELNDRKRKLRKIIDNPIYNPKSPQQNAELFYKTWKINHEMRSRPDKNESVDVAALNEIIAGRFTSRIVKRGDDEFKLVIGFAKELKRFRQLAKQADTYLIGLSETSWLDPENRIFTSLLLHGTTSGRLSSRSPNLQNITRPKEGLPDIRSLFLASDGCLIVQADYSQAELRCIAYLSQDEELLRIYNQDLDLHAIAAENFYGENFTSEQRSRSKNMNFGLFYGQSAATFQEKHDIPEHEAERYIKWAWNNFAGVKDYRGDIIKQIRSPGIRSPFGRKRRFHLITEENKNAIYREAFNFVFQSTAGDFTLRSVIVLQREIDPKKAKIVITVHDNIVSDVKEQYVDEYREICKQVMESRPKEELGWTIPFKIDIGVGDTWGTAK